MVGGRGRCAGGGGGAAGGGVAGQAIGEGEVEEADGDVVGDGPVDGLPLRGEDGERPEGGAGGVVGGVAEQGHGGLQGWVGDPFEQVVGFWGALHEEDLGWVLGEGGDHGAG
ncbi:hypothetical protein Afe05nite_39380 [Paractinoplanes ferrugineus]|uniref:Uncharacterized protein n=1 Tax=Paractinoplanes ferrugineus TaxID=113564 RepID=A0A919J1B2_9ACTN|nr:hypothetical protein Afe05nite_39380 [Actinoplanes ferrugineus]